MELVGICKNSFEWERVANSKYFDDPCTWMDSSISCERLPVAAEDMPDWC